MYPPAFQTVVSVPGISRRWEGQFRPYPFSRCGHDRHQTPGDRSTGRCILWPEGLSADGGDPEIGGRFKCGLSDRHPSDHAGIGRLGPQFTKRLPFAVAAASRTRALSQPPSRRSRHSSRHPFRQPSHPHDDARDRPGTRRTHRIPCGVRSCLAHSALYRQREMRFAWRDKNRQNSSHRQSADFTLHRSVGRVENTKRRDGGCRA